MTKEQYIRSNKVAYPLIMITCVCVLSILIFNGFNENAGQNIIAQVVGIIVAMLIATFFFILKKDEKIGMIVIAGMGGAMYLILSFLNEKSYIFIFGFIILFIC